MTPSAWNSGIFNMVRNLSETVIVPIAGIVLTFVMCYELIQLIVEKEQPPRLRHPGSSSSGSSKTFCAVLIVTNTWNIVMAVFDVAQNVVSQSAGVIISDAGHRHTHGVTADLETSSRTWSIGAPCWGCGSRASSWGCVRRSSPSAIFLVDLWQG